MALLKPSILQAKLNVEHLLLNVSIIGHTTQASIKCFSSNCSDLLIFHEDDTRTLTTYDAIPGFVLGDLNNDAAPAVLGMIFQCGDAAELISCRVPTESIVNTGLTGAMTAGVVTLEGATNGVTAASNITFSVSCSDLDIDEDLATSVNCSFWVELQYRRSQPGF